MASQWFVKVSGAFKEVNEAFVKVSGSWKEVQEGYIKVSGAWKQFYQAFVATSFTQQQSSTTVVVPTGANAIHIQAAVGGGSGGVMGAEYDKAGGESAGAGGASGGYISDKIFTVAEGETLTLTVGSGGAAGAGDGYNSTAGNGGTTSLSGNSTGSIFSLAVGTGGSGLNGGVQGPLRQNNASSAGIATVYKSALTTSSLSFKESNGATVTIGTAVTLDDGPTSTFNQSGNGVAGTNPGNCSGDNCQITGGVGGASYSGVISGGSGGVASSSAGGAGSRGSGGGGGGAQNVTGGGAGGGGEIYYRFLRLT